jgi:hypothetical protein
MAVKRQCGFILIHLSFKKRLAIISDYNTIGNVPISREDYSQMKAAGDDSPESNRLNDIELPSFLNPTPL